MGEARMAPEKAVYAAPQSDQDWLRSVQRELHRRSRDDLDYVFRKLWGFITDPRTLRCAFHRVARNRGSRTAGVDGVTVVKLGRTSGGGAPESIEVKHVYVPTAGRGAIESCRVMQALTSSGTLLAEASTELVGAGELTGFTFYPGNVLTMLSATPARNLRDLRVFNVW